MILRDTIIDSPKSMNAKAVIPYKTMVFLRSFSNTRERMNACQNVLRASPQPPLLKTSSRK